MFQLYVSLVTVTCFCLLKCALAINSGEELTNTQQKGEETDIQRKAPLVDIVFTNGEKRTCTGAIIHENVVITAGHCFTQSFAGGPQLQPELTTSFVVIGSKKKFEAGYEQYLPIEKVIIHPNRKGLSANLALVITFASMSIDNVGGVIPLADAKTYSSNSSNITIMSWGPIVKDKSSDKSVDDDFINTKEEDHEALDDSCVSDECFNKSNNDDEANKSNNDADKEYTTRHGKVQKHYYNRPKGGSTQQNALHRSRASNSNNEEDSSERRQFSVSQSKQTISSFRSLTQAESVQKSIQKNKNKNHKVKKKTTKAMSRYLTAYQGNANFSSELIQRMHKLSRVLDLRRNPKHYQNWRRQLGGQQVNRMTVENFRIVSSQACERTKKAPADGMKLDEMICYTSDGRYITDADSGAPAVREGKLLAITVGDVDSEGDHVAIGMNVSYFCPWIAENLPVGDTTINCWTSAENNDQKNVEQNENPAKYLRNGPKTRPKFQPWEISAEYKL